MLVVGATDAEHAFFSEESRVDWNVIFLLDGVGGSDDLPVGPRQPTRGDVQQRRIQLVAHGLDGAARWR